LRPNIGTSSGICRQADIGKSVAVWRGQRCFILDANAVSDLYFDGFAHGDIARNVVGAWFAIAELTRSVCVMMTAAGNDREYVIDRRSIW
jgi:hypothetical protein